LNPGAQRRLSNGTGLGRAPEMVAFGNGGQEAKLLKARESYHRFFRSKPM
jgi:hypothetical protein